MCLGRRHSALEQRADLGADIERDGLSGRQRLVECLRVKADVGSIELHRRIGRRVEIRAGRRRSLDGKQDVGIDDALVLEHGGDHRFDTDAVADTTPRNLADQRLSHLILHLADLGLRELASGQGQLHLRSQVDGARLAADDADAGGAQVLDARLYGIGQFIALGRHVLR